MRKTTWILICMFVMSTAPVYGKCSDEIRVPMPGEGWLGPINPKAISRWNGEIIDMDTVLFVKISMDQLILFVKHPEKDEPWFALKITKGKKRPLARIFERNEESGKWKCVFKTRNDKKLRKFSKKRYGLEFPGLSANNKLPPDTPLANKDPAEIRPVLH